MKILILEIKRDEIYKPIFIDALVTHLNRANLDLMLAAYYFDFNYRLEWLSEEGRRRAKQFSITMLIEMSLIECGESGRSSTKTFMNECSQYERASLRVVSNSITNVHDYWSKYGIHEGSR